MIVLHDLKEKNCSSIAQSGDSVLAHSRSCKVSNAREVIVAQLVERSLSIPEVRGSTPVTGKILLNICLLTCLLSTVMKRRK